MLQRKTYRKPSLRIMVFGVLLVILLCVAVFFALSIGPVSLSFQDIWQGLLGEGSQMSQTILQDIRAPRMLLAIMVGGSLAISGASLQGLLRNPLADPGLIGITAGASLAVIFVIVFGENLIIFLPKAILPALYSIVAFIGGIITTLLVLTIANLGATFSSGRLILVGIAVTSISGAIIGFLVYLSTDQQLRELTFWTMGSLARSNWSTVLFACTAMLISSAILLRYRQEFDLLQLGERAAFHSGLDVNKVKLQICILVAVAVGAGVSVAGPIGFVGLVAPHMARLFINASHIILLPMSALIGANILLFADLFVRNAIPPAEVPIGIATSALGGPFFLWLLLRNKTL